MASVDGLASGLDTTSIIQSLLSLDAAPQTRLKSSVSTAQQKVQALQSVNAKVTALQTAAEKLARTTGWTPTTATSSSDSVAVTAAATALPGTLGFTVTSLAAGRSIITKADADSDLITPATDVKAKLGMPLDVVKDGKIVGTVEPSSGTLSDVVDAINQASGLGITAVAVRVGEGKYRLQITSTTTGAEKGDFALVPSIPGAGARARGDVFPGPNETPLDLTQGFDMVSEPKDAAITVRGNVVGTPVTVTSATNTFSDVMPGVTMSVSKVSPDPVTIAVSSDPKAVAAGVQGLVDAANAVLTEIQNQTRAGTVGPDGKVTGGGALRGDATLRALKTKVLDAVTGVLSDGSSAAALGVQSTRDGTLTFTQDTFLKAYAKDPSAVRALLAPSSYDTLGHETTDVGVVERLREVAENVTKPFKGNLTMAITSQRDSISDLQRRIADWDAKLAQKKVAYQKYYASLESSLSRMQSQSSWLSGQLAGLG